jgi:copper chaperone
MDTVELKIEGMHCAACVRRVTAAVSKVDGAEAEKVEVGSASVRLDTKRTSLAEVKESIEKAGFQVKEA